MSTSLIFSSKTNNESTSSSLPYDRMMDMFLPKNTEGFSPLSSCPSSFRTTDTQSTINTTDPELFLGDDCDFDYSQALMQSDMFAYLRPLTPDSDDSDIDDGPQVSLKRLRLLLDHLRPPSFSNDLSLSSSTSSSSSSSSSPLSLKKGKARYH